MEPNNIPFNALVVGPTNSGKTKFVVDQLRGPFHGKFDFIALICPTFIHNMTFHRFAEKDPRFYVVVCKQHEVEAWLKLVYFFLEGTKSLIILDDCAASKDVKKRTGELVELAFSGRHAGISTWVITQKMTSITPSFRENAAALVLFYTPSWKTLKAVFDEFAGELSQDEFKDLISRLKETQFSCLVFALQYPFGIKFHTPHPHPN